MSRLMVIITLVVWAGSAGCTDKNNTFVFDAVGGSDGPGDGGGPDAAVDAKTDAGTDHDAGADAATDGEL